MNQRGLSCLSPRIWGKIEAPTCACHQKVTSTPFDVSNPESGILNFFAKRHNLTLPSHAGANPMISDSSTLLLRAPDPRDGLEKASLSPRSWRVRPHCLTTSCESCTKSITKSLNAKSVCQISTHCELEDSVRIGSTCLKKHWSKPPARRSIRLHASRGGAPIEARLWTQQDMSPYKQSMWQSLWTFRNPNLFGVSN